MQLNPTVLANIDVIREAGYAVKLSYDKTIFVATAEAASGQTCTARGADPHTVVCNLAQQIGIKVADG